MTDVDHRPWLILSRREAVALYEACVVRDNVSDDLVRALRQIQLQLEWIASGGRGGEPPTVRDALDRQEYPR